MLVAFFESIKYVGHMVPVAFLRIYLGYTFVSTAMAKLQGDYLLQPHLADAIAGNVAQSGAADWYRSFLEQTVIPHWQIFAYTITYFEFLIGVSLLFGFLVRPISLIGAVLALQYLYISSPEQVVLYKIVVVLFICLSWLGAGRCLGVDYFFFKRQRGVLW